MFYFYLNIHIILRKYFKFYNYFYNFCTCIRIIESTLYIIIASGHCDSRVFYNNITPITIIHGYCMKYNM